VLEYARSAGICMSLVQNWSYICFNHRCPVDASAFGEAKAASHRSFQVELLGWLQDIDRSEYARGYERDDHMSRVLRGGCSSSSGSVRGARPLARTT
jgi:hypothetical protein